MASSLRIQHPCRTTHHSLIHINKPKSVNSVSYHAAVKSPAAVLRRVSACLSLSNLPPASSGGSVVKEDRKTESSSSGESVLKDDRETESSSAVSGKLDEWMKESTVEIVKNLKQAPLLVHIYGGDGDGGRATIKTEKAVAKDWPAVKSEWQNGESRSPDGLIYVEEVVIEEKEEEEEEEDTEEGVTRAWGVVVQGKGMECGPICYLLKTSRVGSGLGMGLFCTHFCLVRVQNFSESALGQFKNSWLLQ